MSASYTQRSRLCLFPDVCFRFRSVSRILLVRRLPLRQRGRRTPMLLCRGLGEGRSIVWVSSHPQISKNGIRILLTTRTPRVDAGRAPQGVTNAGALFLGTDLAPRGGEARLGLRGCVPIPPVCRVNLHRRSGSCINPAAEDPTTGEHNGMGAFGVDHGHF